MYVREGDEMARVCVELIVGSGCQRPIVLRLRTRARENVYYDELSADGEWVWRVGVGARVNSKQCSDASFPAWGA